jgi:thioredoxin-related protein
MRKLAFLLLPFIAGAQGIDFHKGTFEEVLSLAQEQDKLIFVDAYAVWCGPCKVMDKQVFPLKEVGDYYNKHFISIKLDMERGEGLKFRRDYPVSAFPTFFFIDSEGSVVYKARGARKPQDFIKLGMTAVSRYDKTAIYAAKYEEGNRDAKLIYDYIKALNRKGESSLRITNEYIDNQELLDTDQDMMIIYEGTVEADSRVFDLLIENRVRISKLTSADDVEARIERACEETVGKAIEFQVPFLLEEAQNKLSKALPEKADDFELHSNLRYSLGLQDADLFTKSARAYVKEGANAYQLDELARKAIKVFHSDEKVMGNAVKWAKKASEDGGNASYFVTYAQALRLTGKESQADKMIDRAYQLAEEQEISQGDIDQLRKILQGS